jgi:hypothetical protein
MRPIHCAADTLRDRICNRTELTEYDQVATQRMPRDAVLTEELAKGLPLHETRERHATFQCIQRWLQKVVF